MPKDALWGKNEDALFYKGENGKAVYDRPWPNNNRMMRNGRQRSVKQQGRQQNKSGLRHCRQHGPRQRSGLLTRNNSNRSGFLFQP